MNVAVSTQAALGQMQHSVSIGLVGAAGRVLAVSLGLALLNAVVVLPLFTGEYTQYMGSIESARLSDARFITENWPYAGWNPLGYLGFPFHLFYAPLLPYLVAAVHKLPLALSTAAAYRVVTAFAYVLGPVTLYLFVRYLTKRELTAVLAALAYSLMPSFVYVIGGVRSDTPVGLFGHPPWRLIVMTWHGEGAHIAALTLTPLAALFFLYALKRPSFTGYVIAALAVAAIALMNWIAIFALAVVLAVVLFSEMLLGEPGRKLISAFTVVAIAYGLSAFWLNLSFVKASLTLGNSLGGPLDYSPLMLLILAVPLVGICYLLFSGKPQRQKLFIPAAWFAIFAVSVFGWYLFDLNLALRPHRYGPELNMSACILGAMLVVAVYDRFRAGAADLGKAVATALVGLVVVAIIVISLPFLRAAWDLTRPSADVYQTSEYRVARWLEDNTDGARVYATGTHAFWLNAFFDVPQVRGGADFAGVNPWWDHVVYQINKGVDGELAVMWARALNVRYIVVNFPESEVRFRRDITYPHKFDGLLPERFSYRGDTVYEVPTDSPEPVQVVNLPRFQALPPLEDVLDRDGLEAYVQAVESSEGVDASNLQMDGPSQMTITTDLVPGQGLLVRTSYHRGWTAWAEGTKVDVSQDPVGFMLLQPQAPGRHQIVLEYHEPWDVRFGYLITAITVLALAVLAVRPVRQRLAMAASEVVKRWSVVLAEEENDESDDY